MAITVRRAEERDLPHIFRIEKRSYPPYLQAKHDVLLNRFRSFGILVAENERGAITGFSTMVPTVLPWADKRKVVEKVMKNRHPHYEPWFREYEQGGACDTLWVTSTAVETQHQSKGVGGELIRATLKLAKEKGLKYRASALKTEYPNKRLEGETIEQYLDRVKAGKVQDRFLHPYLKQGFTLAALLPEYEPDHPRRKSKGVNYNVLAFKKL